MWPIKRESSSREEPEIKNNVGGIQDKNREGVLEWQVWKKSWNTSAVQSLRKILLLFQDSLAVCGVTLSSDPRFTASEGNNKVFPVSDPGPSQRRWYHLREKRQLPVGHNPYSADLCYPHGDRRRKRRWVTLVIVRVIVRIVTVIVPVVVRVIGGIIEIVVVVIEIFTVGRDHLLSI